mmetsp:Transcript_114397/g.323381  ORF Transcript_114397/g.323381 Transcript_114397/m.323381 type:complete len:245 (-) Transcript_114397:417-1151(-)
MSAVRLGNARLERHAAFLKEFQALSLGFHHGLDVVAVLHRLPGVGLDCLGRFHRRLLETATVLRHRLPHRVLELLQALSQTVQVTSALLLQGLARLAFGLNLFPRVFHVRQGHAGALLDQATVTVNRFMDALQALVNLLDCDLAHVPLRLDELAHAGEALAQLAAVVPAQLLCCLNRGEGLAAQRLHGLFRGTLLILHPCLEVGHLAGDDGQPRGRLVVLVTDKFPLHLRQLLTTVFNEVDRRV